MIARKIFIILGMALLLLSCGSSKEKSYVNPYTSEVLDGMFQLRLGMSEAEIIEVISKSPKAKYEDRWPKEYHSYTMYNGQEKLVTRLAITNYTPTQGFTITHMNLYFFEDKLFEIEFFPEKYLIEGEDVNYKMLQELLTEKYGQPKEKKNSWNHIVFKPYGERTGEYDTIKEKTRYSETTKRWMTNSPNIDCIYYYNSARTYFDSIKITNTDIEPQLEERARQEKEEQKNIKKEEIKKIANDM